jgi:putative ABC transport system substrate-binding protein
MKDPQRRRVLFLAGAIFVSCSWAGEDEVQGKVRRIGMFGVKDGPAAVERGMRGPFYRGLQKQGWIEGKNIAFIYASDSSGYPEAAAELVRLKVDVILADSAAHVRAAHGATHTIPIVGLDFTSDPVAAGFIDSYSRPGRNITGVFLDAPEFSAKWLELLKSIVPDLKRVAVLWDPRPGDTHLRALRASANSINIQLQVIEVHTPGDIDRVEFASRGRPQALVILPAPLTYQQESARLAKLAIKQRLPATSMAPMFAEFGGLFSYGPEMAYERGAELMGKILSGTRPADLPAERPRRFELSVNMKAATALNLTIPDSVLVAADKIIR